MFELSVTTMWMIGGFLVFVAALIKYIFDKIQDELSVQSDKLATKVDTTSLHDMEQRWKDALNSVRDNNKELIDKLESRHDREIVELGTRLGEQIKNSETNILAQIRLMVDTLRVVHPPQH